jgi:hypothetical protein
VKWFELAQGRVISATVTDVRIHLGKIISWKLKAISSGGILYVDVSLSRFIQGFKREHFSSLCSKQLENI